MIRIAIIVLHFGDIQITTACLLSLKKIKTKIPFQVFVVDNGTDMITKQSIQKILPQAILIKNKKNLGYGGGNNTAITYVLQKDFSHIFILNNDTLVRENILDTLISGFKNPDIGIVGPVITYSQNNNKIWFAGGTLFRLLCITKHDFLNKSLDIFLKAKEKPTTDFITGAAIMIKKEVFKKIGLFSESYFLYWEDVDFCFRARVNNFHCHVVKDAFVTHFVSANAGRKGSNILSKIRAYYYSRNPFIFMKKNKLTSVLTVLGQFVMFPYYLVQCESFSAKFFYVKGFFEGLLFLFN